MDEQDTEYLKLSVEDRCQHKMWKARVSGYEAATKLFQQITDEKSPEWNKYLGLVKKFVTDSNAVAQEKGLDAVLAYVENAGNAGKTCGEVVSGIVSKCLGAPKARTKEKGQAIILMYIEIEKHELVNEELIKGFSNKTPKVVVACIQTVREALKEFGPKVVSLKPLIKQLPTLLEDRDKGVRDETKLLTVEIFRWIGAALKPQLTSLKPVMLTELETEFEKIGTAKAVPTRFLRSQQEIQARAQQELATDDADDIEEDECDGGEAIDPYDLLEPVNILSKLPADFYEKCEAKKWQERKEAMDVLQQLSANPKLEPGDYSDVVRVLKKIIGKDTNVVVIAIAGKCLTGLANGLKAKFHPYAGQCICTILEKFKEKKQNVVQSLREAIDAIYPSTTLDAIHEDIVAALDNKNPSVKTETAAFLARCFSRCNMVILNKKLLKTFCTILIKTLNDTDPAVRDNSAEALGTAMKVVGEKVMLPYLQEVDAIKMGKVKECCEKAVIVAPKVPGGVKVKAVRSAPSQQRKDTEELTTARKNIPQKSASVPSTNRKVVRGGQPKSGRKGDGSASATCVTATEFDEKELTPEEAEERASEFLSPEILNGICDSNWKLRLSFMEQFLEVVKSSDRKNLPVQVLVRTLAKKPGFKENNFQVLKLKIDTVVYLASEGSFSRCTAKFCILELTDKLGDAKNGALVAEALSAIAQASKLEFVSNQVLETAFAQKSPKTHMEAMNWLATAIKEFGLQIQVKSVIEHIKKAIAATNPGVRSAAVNLLGVMYLYTGSSLRTFFDSEKGAMLQQIDAEFEKLQGIAPPAPTRGVNAEAELGDGAGDEEGGESNPSVINIADLIPRTEICASISHVLLQEMSDKNWKTRGEALQKLANIISEAKFITPNLGDLPPVLKSRMVDSNKNLAVQALNICQAIGTAMGPNCTKHVHTLAPGMITSLGDNKNNVRAAALSCLNGWLEQCGLGPFIEGDMLADALKLENPCLRSELLGWLTVTLPQTKTVSPDLMLCVPHLYSCLEDRNSDVRKKAMDAVLPFMVHLGYEKMVQATGKLKPASKSVIAGILEKTKPNLPAKPAPKRAQNAGGGAKNGGTHSKSAMNSTSSNNRSSQEDLGGSGGSAKAGNAKNGMKRATSRSRLPGTTKPSTGKKKDEDVDTSPPLQQNNQKEQRQLDEQRLKVLRWNFTAPREEFYIQLKDQMSNAGFNRNLQAHMFHNDFKFHIRAIETLIECLDSNPDATVANLDLVLKWLALRFFDTNPSVLLKGLEYLQSLFVLLAQNKYHLSEYEANSFIPYLVMKVGDPKDTVRQSVRSIFKHICQVYAASRMFTHVIEGLKSKNARQRTECLEELGCLIEGYGVNVCQPSATAALKEVTRHISDRDNSVRNAALNCIVQAYVLEGEKVYKYVGPISDKDLCLLEERIKRTSRNRPVSTGNNRGPTVSPEAAKIGRPVSKQQLQHTSPGQIQTVESVKEPEEEQETVVKRRSNPPTSRPTSGMFCLDLDRIEQMMEEKVELELPKLIKPDLDEILSASPVRLPETRLRPPSPAAKLLSNSSDISAALDLVISQSASNDITTAVNALAQIDEFLKDEDRAEIMQSRVDQLILAETFQFRMVYSRHMSDETTNRQEIMRLYRCLTMTLVTLFNNRGLAKKASKDVLCDLIYNLIAILLDDRLNLLDDGPQVVRSINVLIVKVVERASSTNILSALIKLLSDCVGSETCSTKFIELVMKCLWKMVRMMPTIVDDLNLDKILLELHLFLKAFPSSQWKDRSSDLPLRTVKTVLHSLVHHKGNKILDHLSAIDNLRDSELEQYVQRLLKSANKHRGMEGDGSKPAKKDSKSPKRLSKNTHEMLAEIFKKIGSKEYTKEGLADLYDFKKNHPDADVEPFLKKSSQFFQNYIERGLHVIDMDRNSKSSSAVSTPTRVPSRQSSQDSTTLIPGAGTESVDLMPIASVNSNANNLAATVMNANLSKQIDANIGLNSEEHPSVFMERLKILRARCGYDNTMYEKSMAASFLAKGYATPPEPLSHMADLKTEEPLHISTGMPRSESSDAVTALTGKTNSDVDELRQRLERIKNATKLQ